MNESNNLGRRIEELINIIESKEILSRRKNSSVYRRSLKLYRTGIDFCTKCSEVKRKVYVGEILFSDAVDSVESLTARILRDMNKKAEENIEESDKIIDYHLVVWEEIRKSANNINISTANKVTKSEVNSSYLELREKYLYFLKEYNLFYFVVNSAMNSADKDC